MRTADNDNIGSSNDLLSSESSVHKTGLSSAMHDMRLLAQTYQEHRDQADDADAASAHQAIAVDPRVLLMPKAEAPTERWKILMLSAMILVGLSTSAIAVRLVMQPDSAQSTYNSKYVEPISTPTLSSPAVELPELVLPIPQAPSTRYELIRSPESSRVNPETHEAVVPPIKRKRKRAAARSQESRTTEAPTKVANSCDEVACLIGDDAACCGTLPDERNEEWDAEEELASRPYRLSRAQVMGPMKSILGRVGTCADTFDYQGVALVKIVITPEGSVGNFDLDDGEIGFQSCVQKQVETLRFPKLSQPFTVSYPYSLR